MTAARRQLLGHSLALLGQLVGQPLLTSVYVDTQTATAWSIPIALLGQLVGQPLHEVPVGEPLVGSPRKDPSPMSQAKKLCGLLADFIIPCLAIKSSFPK